MIEVKKAKAGLIHYTLDTGHSRVSPRGEVRDDVLAKLEPMLEPGCHLIPGPPGGYRCRTSVDGSALLASVVDGEGEPLVTFGVAPDSPAADRLWSGLKATHTANQSSIRRPERTPWCAVVIGGALPSHFDTTEWLGDFERCLAWAWIEHQTIRRRGE